MFAAGDVRSGSVKRVASAVGEGAMAVRLVYEHLQAAGRSSTSRRGLDRSRGWPNRSSDPVKQPNRGIMPTGTVDSIERTVQKTNEWLDDLAHELGTDDEPQAWRVLRAYLQTLRDRLTVEEAAQLAAQLPHLVRGVFYEGFDPTRQPEKLRDREAFLSRLAERAQLAGPDEAERAAVAATRVLRRHISEGEFDDVLAQLPAQIRELLAQA